MWENACSMSHPSSSKKLEGVTRLLPPSPGWHRRARGREERKGTCSKDTARWGWNRKNMTKWKKKARIMAKRIAFTICLKERLPHQFNLPKELLCLRSRTHWWFSYPHPSPHSMAPIYLPPLIISQKILRFTKIYLHFWPSPPTSLSFLPKVIYVIDLVLQTPK